MFRLGDLVFAKVRGWCPWPGKIMCQVSPNHFKIFFYGTNQESLVKIGNIWSAQDNLEQSTKNYRKRKGYSRSLEKMKNKPNSFAENLFDLCPHKCITCDPKKMEARAKSSFQMEKTTRVVNVHRCLSHIESQKVQVLVKKNTTSVHEKDDNSSTERREKEMSPGLEEDSSEYENEEREAENGEKMPPPKASTEKTEKELRMEARETRREEEERKCEEEERKREEEYSPVLDEMPKKKQKTCDRIVLEKSDYNRTDSGEKSDYNRTDSDEKSLDASATNSVPSPKPAKSIPSCTQGELMGQASEKQSEMETSSQWSSRLEQLLKDAGDLEEEAYGCYRIDISNTEIGSEHFFLELSRFSRRVLRGEGWSNRPADVHVSLSSDDLAGVLGGSVSPIMAYLTGRISAKGDFSKLLVFSKLSKEGQRP